MRQEILLDTCVLLDIFIKGRERHEYGQRLLESVRDNNIYPKIPMISLFELKSAIDNYKMGNGDIDWNTGINEIKFSLGTISINEDFIGNYYNPDLPYLKANDLIFLSIASKDEIPLITEDNFLYKKAKECGVEVYKTEEFINKNIR